MTDVTYGEISTPLIYFATADSQEFLFVVKLQGAWLDLSSGLVAVRKLTLHRNAHRVCRRLSGKRGVAE